MSTLLAPSVGLGTQRTYKRKWDTWVSFWLTAGRTEEDAYMEGLKDSDRVAMLVQFINQALKPRLMDPSQVWQFLAGVKHHLIIGGDEATCFKSAVLKKAVQACQLSPEELRIRGRKLGSKQRLPLPAKAFEALRDRFWFGHGAEERSVRDRLTEQMVYLALVYGYSSMSRGSNVAAPDGPSEPDHAVRSEDTTFTLSDGRQMTPGELRANPPPISEVVRVNSMEYSSKTQKLGRPRELAYGQQYAQDLAAWCLQGGGVMGVQLFSRSCGNRTKLLTKRMLNDAIKWAAEACGLSSKAFGCHSLRHGGSAQRVGAGEETAAIEERGGWAAGSSAFRRNYSRVGGVDNLAGGVLEEQGFQPGEVVSLRARSR